MNKKVIKSSNKNEKYNLKSVLDTDNIISGVSLKTVTTIGCASIIASCGGPEKGDKGNEDKTKLKWDDFKEYQSKFKNGKEDFDKFVSECKKKGISEDDITKMIENLDKQDVQNVLDGKEIKEENGKITIDGKAIDLTKTTPETNDTLSNFNNLTEKQKETLIKTYGITNQETLDEFFKIPGNEGFKEKKNSDLFDANNNAIGDFKTKLEAFKASKDNDELKGILKLIMSETEITPFLNYVDYIDGKFEKKDTIIKSINEKKGNTDALKGAIKEFCEKYVKQDGNINYDGINKVLSNKNDILTNLIKQQIDLGDGQDINKLKFTYSKGNNCINLKITCDKDTNKSVVLEIKFNSEELLKLKEKDGKEHQLHRLKEENFIDDVLNEDKKNEIKNLFPKKKDETAMNKIKATIKSELEKSLKDNNNDVKIDSFVNVAKVLKPLITTAKKLNTGKINANGNDEWIYENISSVNDLDALFGGTQGEYVKAVTAEYDAIITKIKTNLAAINAGELSSNAKEKKEYKMTETIESATIKATINDHFEEDAAKLIEYIPDINTQKAKIEFDDNYNVIAIQLPSGFEVVTGNVLEYGSNGNAADASKTDALTALKTELKKVLENICKNSFGKDKLDSGKNVKNKDEIKNYIDTELTYDKVKTLDDAKINGLEATLKDKCGFNIKTLTTKAQIETDIVEPLLAKVFGDKNNCKAVFTNLEALAVNTVKQGADVKLNANDGSGSFANIKNSDDATAIGKIDGTGGKTTEFLQVFTAIKVKIKAVNDALKKIINESDNNKKASDAFIKALKTIIGEPGIDNGVSNSDHLSLAFNNKASLLFKWMYVNGQKWNDPGAQGANHHEEAIKSFVNVLACFLNKQASYKGVATSANTIASNKIDWSEDGAAGGVKSTLLNAGAGIKVQLADTSNALMIEKAKKVKIYFNDNLVPNTYVDITVSDLKQAGPQNNFTAGDILIDPNAAQKPQIYYIFQLVGGHDKYKHKILGKANQELAGALKA